jgi:hypothetical protein
LEDMGVDVRIILKLNFHKYLGGTWVGFMWLGNREGSTLFWTVLSAVCVRFTSTGCST